MPPALVRRVLESASPDVVLIGGQALAYWMGYYDVHTPGRAPPAVTHGVDFFARDAGNIAPLRAFAQAIGGQFRLAIEVARKYLEERIDGIEQAPALGDGARNRESLDVIRDVVAYSAEDAARKNAQRYGIFLADAIPAWRIRSTAFWERRWPHLRERNVARPRAGVRTRGGARRIKPDAPATSPSARSTPGRVVRVGTSRTARPSEAPLRFIGGAAADELAHARSSGSRIRGHWRDGNPCFGRA